jgi:hypothetical protein
MDGMHALNGQEKTAEGSVLYLATHLYSFEDEQNCSDGPPSRPDRLILSKKSIHQEELRSQEYEPLVHVSRMRNLESSTIPFWNCRVATSVTLNCALVYMYMNLKSWAMSRNYRFSGSWSVVSAMFVAIPCGVNQDLKHSLQVDDSAN